MLAVVTVRPRLCAEGPEAALQLRLDHIYAWEATADGNGFCLRLSEGDIQAGLLDRATFRMRPGEGVSVITHHKSVLLEAYNGIHQGVEASFTMFLLP